MYIESAIGILLPLFGTLIGSACVFLSNNSFTGSIQKLLSGFAAGVMVAASVWSLLIPSVEYASKLGFLSFVPAVVGFWLGIVILMMTERAVMRLNILGLSVRTGAVKATAVTVLAVTLHNFPEGMAVGTVYAALLSGDTSVSAVDAIVLSAGIAVQNLPEGAVISLPLKAIGASRGKAFVLGALSGVVEPLGAVLTIALSSLFLPVLPYFLGFAAGAMIYAVVEELLPDAAEGKSYLCTISFAAGFSLMMALDVALG